MRTLAFDVSTATGGVAVLDGEDVIFAETFASPRGRGGEFFPVLARAVAAAGDFQRVVVGLGPGSYNGLRAALAAAEALHLARGAARVGVISALGLSETDDYFAVGDARGGVLWLARITGGRLAGEIDLLPEPEVRARLAGAGPVVTTSSALGWPVASPDPALLARRAGAPSATPLEPAYLKPPHITTPRERGKRE